MSITKWTNCIYINRNPAYNLVANLGIGILDELKESNDARYIVKIGSSKCLPARYHSYKTYTPIQTELVRYYYLENYDCYELDADLKKHLNRHRVHSSGGIEFYYCEILDVLEQYMLDKNIVFARYDTINDFPSWNPATMYKSLADEEIARYQVSQIYIPKSLPTGLETSPSPELELSSHQNGIKQLALEHFKKHDRGILNLFCRYGKTRLSAAFNLAARYARVLILVPSLYLIEQTRKTWCQAFPTNCIITISSDASDISPTEISYITQRIEELSPHAIVICTYHSSNKLADLYFDLCIYDEAHRTTGDKSTFNALVSSSNICKKLFLTATMKFYDYLDGEDGTLVINSMDNPDIYGDVIASVSAKEALQLGRICPYSVMTIKLQEIPENPQLQHLEALTLSDNFLDISSNSSNDSTAVDEFIRANVKRYIRIALGLLEVIKKYRMRHIITFHRFKKCARLFQYILEYISKNIINLPHSPINSDKSKSARKHKIVKKSKLEMCLEVEFISGESIKSIRDKIIEDFNTEIMLENQHKVLCNAKVLQEGVDIPRCDAVCFVDLKTSAVDTIQSLARCMTHMPEKHAYILIPFDQNDLVPDTTDPGSLDIKYCNYAQQLRLLLRNLVEIDDNIKEYFRKCSTQININPGSYPLADVGDINSISPLLCLIDESIIAKMCEIAFEPFTIAKDKIKGQYMTPEEYRAKILADYKGDIPLEPDVVYRGWGWRGWNDYLGIDPYMRPSAVRKLMHAVNQQRLESGVPLIDTAASYREYAKANNLMVELQPPHSNWCWLLLPDYDSLVASYYQTKEEIQAAIMKLEIKSITDYEARCMLDSRLAPYRHLAAGFYNERIPSLGKHVSNFITELYTNDNSDCFF